MTATKKFSTTEIEDLQFQLQQQQSKPTSLFDERPQTSAIVQSQRIGENPNERVPQTHRIGQTKATQLQSVEEEDSKKQGVKGQVIFINITDSWGDLFYVGLNGLQVLDERGRPIPISVEPGQTDPRTGLRTKTSVHAEPRDMNSIPGHGQDHRTLEKLFNEKNNTTDDRNMWLVPFNKGDDHTVRIDLGEQRGISAVRFYNYNKSAEDTLRGAKQVIIRVDDKLMTPKKGVTLRVAPGTTQSEHDIGQDIKLPFKSGWTNDQIVPVQRSLDQATGVGFHQEYESIAMPVGFSLKINLYSTHGDLFYIGLNGIELYDQNGEELLSSRRNAVRICAHPAGVHTLKGMEEDTRVISNIGDGKNNTSNDSHIWLAPYNNTKGHTKANAKENTAMKREPNYILILFEQPIALGAFKLWSYSKTPARGVNEYELEVDGQKVYRGYARMAPEQTSSSMHLGS